MGDDKLDAQTSARLLKRALRIKGSREKLAEILGVHPQHLALWIAGKAFPPQAIFEKVLEIILDEGSAVLPVAEKGPAPRRRVLVADSPEGCAVLAKILGHEFVLVTVHTLTDGLDLLQNGAVAGTRSIDAIVCGQHFEGSQMLPFLECVKAYRPTSATPFICCRSTATQLREPALAAVREACEALGAVAYIDLPERAQNAGAERAAVEFRDAVRAVMHLAGKTAGLRILVADDNPDASHVLHGLLRIAGHKVYKAADGAQALQVASELRPDVVILDIAMPGLSGYEVAKKIRAESWGGGVVLIALTGYAGAQDGALAREAGFDHHFRKPVAVERMLEVFPAPRPRAHN